MTTLEPLHTMENCCTNRILDKQKKIKSVCFLAIFLAIMISRKETQLKICKIWIDKIRYRYFDDFLLRILQKQVTAILRSQIHSTVMQINAKPW